MLRTRRVSYLEGLRYQGKGSMLAWALHRITGLGILFFVGTHIVAAFFLNAIGDNISKSVTLWYESTPFQIFIYFCVLYHAFNGLRVVIEDFYPPVMRYRRELLWLQWLIFLPVFALPSFLMVLSLFSGSA